MVPWGAPKTNSDLLLLPTTVMGSEADSLVSSAVFHPYLPGDLLPPGLPWGKWVMSVPLCGYPQGWLLHAAVPIGTLSSLVLHLSIC